MENLTYEHICSATGCKFHVVWDFGHGDCYSCRKIGESYNVTEYPQDCQFKSEMQRYESDSQKMDVCDHKDTIIRYGIKQCSDCGKPL